MRPRRGRRGRAARRRGRHARPGIASRSFLGLEALGPAVEAVLEGLGVLAGQDEGLGGHAVLDGVEPRSLLALGGSGARCSSGRFFG